MMMWVPSQTEESCDFNVLKSSLRLNDIQDSEVMRPNISQWREISAEAIVTLPEALGGLLVRSPAGKGVDLDRTSLSYGLHCHSTKLKGCQSVPDSVSVCDWKPARGHESLIAA